MFDNTKSNPNIVDDQSSKDTMCRMLFKHMHSAFVFHKIICDPEGHPVDYIFLDVNPSFEQHLGIKAEDIIGNSVKHMFPETEQYWIDKYGEVALFGNSVQFQDYSVTFDKYFKVSAYSPAKGYFVTVFDDVTEYIKTQNQLKATNEKLINTNQELATSYEELETTNEELVATHEELLASEEMILKQLEQLQASKDAVDRVNQRLSDIIEFLPDATFVIDSDKKVIAWNKAVESMTGVKKEQMIGKGNYAYAVPFYGEARPMLLDLIALEDNELEGRYNYQHLRREGNTLYAEIYNPNVYAGKGAFFKVAASPLFDRHGNIVGAIESIRNISDYKRLEEERKRHFNLSIDMLCIANFDGYFVDVNPAWERVLGFSRSQLLSIPYLDLIHPEDRESAVLAAQGLSEGQVSVAFNNRYQCADGSYKWLSWNSFPLVDEGLIYAVVRDITDQRLSEEALKDSEAKFRSIVENAYDVIYSLDRDGNVLYVSPNVGENLGYQASELEGNKLVKFIHPEDKQKFHSFLYQLFNTDQRYAGVECRIRNEKGNWKWHKINASVLKKDDQGSVLSCIGISRDITESKEHVEQLKYISLHDSLTGLKNRVYFEQQMYHIQENKVSPVGIIICDVDGLKLVNDTLGHTTGDALLMLVAGALRECFCKEEVVARVGGDEFAIIFPRGDLKTVEDAYHQITKRITDYNDENPDLLLNVSMGYAVSSKPQINMMELYKTADDKMHREKLHRSQSARSAIVQTLKKALEARDYITEGHADRLQDLMAAMAKSLGLSESQISDMKLLGQFHDIGKVGIPDRILFKPGILTEEEHNEMKRHCEIGYRIALAAQDLVPVADWILAHHEWWNGEGYPRGIKGEEIPLECRVLSIVDSYDAMTSDRPYRKAMSHQEAIAELIRCSGTQFDPELVDRFIDIISKRARNTN